MNVFKYEDSISPRGRILLVNPWIHDFAAYDLWMKPLGLLYLASILRENGYALSFIDCLASPGGRRKTDGSGNLRRTIIAKPEPLAFFPRNYSRYGATKEEIWDRLQRLPAPELILVTSSMTYWYPGVMETIRLLKSAFPSAPLVLGGTYSTLCPQHAKEKSGADHVIAGAGELALAGILQQFLGKDLTYLPDSSDLDSSPYPALDLIGQLDYAPIRTSRGCPYLCGYCASSILSGQFRQRDPEAIFREISYWYEIKGVRHFSLFDDAFLINQERVAIPLLKKIRREGLNCLFHAPNGLHLREINSIIAKLLYQTNFRTIRFGFETHDLQRQVALGGKVINEELLAAVSYLRQAGYQKENIGVYILVGLPGQEMEEVRKTMEFVFAAGARPILAEYSPVPGTLLWEQACQQSPWDIAREPLFHNNSILPCQNPRLTYKMYEKLKAFGKHGLDKWLPGNE